MEPEGNTTHRVENWPISQDIKTRGITSNPLSRDREKCAKLVRESQAPMSPEIVENRVQPKEWSLAIPLKVPKPSWIIEKRSKLSNPLNWNGIRP